MVLARSNLLFPVTAWKRKYEEEVKICIQVHHLETGLDGLDTTRGVAGHALQEEQPRLLVQDCVRGSASHSVSTHWSNHGFWGVPACVAGDILLDVPSQHILYVLLLESPWEHKKNHAKISPKLKIQPFMMSWLLPSMAPLVPSSAKRKASKC